MLEGKTRIPAVDVETLPDDLRKTLEEQRKLYGACPVIASAYSSATFSASLHACEEFISSSSTTTPSRS